MKKFALGLMSGTSGDGVSLALASFTRRTFKLHAHRTYGYPLSLSDQILDGASLDAAGLSRLNFRLGHFFADRVLHFLGQMKVSPSSIAVIGSHGQTVYHGPGDNPPNTLQIGEPCVIAERTGISVAADFRPRDMAAGGEGAPLMPFFDQFFFGGGPARALQNIGGIGNVTFVGKNVRPLAFDTGPGNCLLDSAVRELSRGRQRFDRDGNLARRGAVDLRAVGRLMEHSYFSKRPPKSSGREVFGDDFVPVDIKRMPPESRIATLSFLTAFSIYESYRRFLPRRPAEVIVSGGGRFNPVIMQFLSALLHPAAVRPIEDYGLPAQAKEPLAFAFLGWRALRGEINHAPAGTGAAHACVLGKIIPGRRP